MPVQETNVIDFVAHDPKTDTVKLVMVEARDWGDKGDLLPDLQSKFSTYLTYALDGQLATDYPTYAGKPIHFELRTEHAPTQREQQFMDIVVREHLEPERITFRWQLIGKSAPQQTQKSKWKFWQT
jgi:hypothetical protein